MLFNSLEFAVFFPAVVGGYFVTPQRYRWVWLLGASYLFYAWWEVEYLILILVSTLVDYGAGLQMGKRSTRRARRPYLVASIVVNLGILGTFKYFNFFSGSLQSLLAQGGMAYEAPLLDFLLPVGISFYTFQSMAYSIDVYRGKKTPERHLGYFALYVSFFPQLVAGPIERAQRLLPQLRAPHRFDYDRVSWGLVQMAYGFFKKMVVADRLGQYVDVVYGDVASASPLSAFVATVFFAFQIYCDFSGYADIAIGGARVLGIDLMENFRRPYLARSLRDFWGRWHISLSTWFRDYLYIPLGGRRVSTARWLANLMVVFLVSGLWHGANWTYVAWGAFHGSLLIGGVMTADLRDRIWAGLGAEDRTTTYRTAGWRGPAARGVQAIRTGGSIACTFGLVLVGWVFFRAESIGEAVYLLIVMAHFDGSVQLGPLLAGLGPLKFGLNLLVIGLLLISYRLPVDLKIRPRLAFLLLMTFLIIFLGTDGGEPFIYFQF